MLDFTGQTLDSAASSSAAITSTITAELYYILGWMRDG